MERVDLLIIGGGINGAGIAAQACERGLSVYLCEQNDFASATSSASSKMIHGGLRYLEQYDFGLVRDSLQEREILMRKAPHLIQPQRFIMPHQKHLRSAWLIRMGLFLYDHLARHTLSKACRVCFDKSHDKNPLNRSLRFGFEYSDCVVDDARLVLANLVQAKRLGAQLLNYTACTHIEAQGDHWLATLQSSVSENPIQIEASAVINATGPWVNHFIEKALEQPVPHSLRLVQGSHLVIPRLYAGDEAYLLQNTDRRVVFVIPYQKFYTLIGTTDTPYEGDPAHTDITEEEITYLCDVVNRNFHKKISPSDVLHHFSGVRPLVEDNAENPSQVSRGYQLLGPSDPESPPLLHVFGGKLTTYRHLAEEAVAKIAHHFEHITPPPLAHLPLPGGDLEDSSVATFLSHLVKRYPDFPESLLSRYVHAYGQDIFKILGHAQDMRDLGHHFGHGLFEQEVSYLCEHEWAVTAEDILWRRTKLGLLFSTKETEKLSAWLEMAYADQALPSVS